MSLLTGLFLGFLLTLITGMINFLSVKKSHPHPTHENVEVHHLRIITLNISYDEAFDLCKASLQLVKKPNITHQNLEAGEISARARMSWRDWGDKIEFRLREEEANQTYVEVTSKPFLPGTVLDYGHNLQNVEAIITFLEEHNPPR